jgi:hypothetical protein
MGNAKETPPKGTPPKSHLRRLLTGSMLGFIAALACNHAPPSWQMPCKFLLIAIHAWVNG